MAGVTITITGKNGVSQTFEAIGRDATELATSLENTGRRGATAMTQAGESAQTMGKEIVQASEQSATAAEHSAEAAESSFSKWSEGARNIGVALGALTLEAGKSAGELQAAQAQMATSFQDAGLSVDDYSGQIEAAVSKGEELAFNQKSIDTSLASLVGVTKDAGRAFSDLQLAEDIARGTGESLAAATSTVTQVEAGRYRGLASLGIALDATSTKQDYLAAIQQRFAGQSEAFATTGQAQFERWKNTAEAALEGVGAHLSAIQGPLLAVSASTTILGEVGKVLGETGIASTALDLAMGPAGLAAAALAAGAGIYYLVTQSHDYVSAAETAIGVTDSLTNMLVQLEAASSPQNALIIDSLQKQVTAFIDYAGTAQDRVKGLADLASVMGQGARSLDLLDQTQVQTAEDTAKMTQAQLQALDVNHDNIVTYQEMEDALNGVSTAVSGAAGLMQSLNTDQLKHFSDDFANFMALPHLKIPEATAAVSDLIVQFQNGALTADQFLASMDDLLVHTKPYIDVVTTTTQALTANTAATSAQTAAVITNGQAIANQMAAYAAANPSLDAYMAVMGDNMRMTVANGDAVAAQMAVYDANNQSLDQAIQFNAANTTAITQSTAATILHQSALSGDAAALAAIGQSQASVSVPASQLTEAFKQQTQSLKDDESAAQAAAKAIDAYRSALGEVHMVVNDGANQFAKHATVAGNELDAGQRVAIGNTDAIAQTSQGVADWADKLIGVRGVYAEIDDLVAKGLLTGTKGQKEYNDAQSAETSILHNNAAIQRDIMKIQVDQAPLIATLTKNEREYMDQLAKDTPQQQLVRLGYMDSAESAKALADAQLAASAAAGELGKNGVETANKMIIASAEADPVLEAMLQDMGLINVGADGTISVNYDDVTKGKDETQLLIDAITLLDSDIKTAFHIGVEAGDVDAAFRVTSNLNNQLDLLADRHITYSVVGNYSTTGTGSGTVSVGGSSDQANLNTGDSGGGGSPVDGGTGNDVGIGAYNGGVPGYANGGAVRSWLAEIDPEIVHLAGGGVALARSKGIYDVPRGSYVSTAPATRSLMAMGGPTIQVIVQGNIYGMDDLTEQVTRELTPALVAAFESHYAGYGV